MAEIPLGINGMHTSATFHLLDGDGSQLPGLASLPDMRRWDGVLHTRNNTMELRQLNGSVALSSNNGQMCMPIGDFDGSQWDDPKFARFRASTAEATAEAPPKRAFLATTHQGLAPDPIVADLICQGKCGVMKRACKATLAEALTSFSAEVGKLVDHHQTFMVEVFCGEGNTTMRAVHGGHVVGQPLDIRYGIDLHEVVITAHLCEWVAKYKPWLVTIAFPCTAYSRLNMFLNAHLAPRFAKQKKFCYVFNLLWRGTCHCFRWRQAGCH